MAYTMTQARKLLTTAELAVFETSRPQPIKALSAARLRSKVNRTRALRDKYRDLYQRQTVASRSAPARKRSPVGADNERTQQKADLFSEVLARYEERLQKVEASEQASAARDEAARAKRASKGARGEKAAKSAKAAKGVEAVKASTRSGRGSKGRAAATTVAEAQPKKRGKATRASKSTEAGQPIEAHRSSDVARSTEGVQGAKKSRSTRAAKTADPSGSVKPARSKKTSQTTETSGLLELTYDPTPPKRARATKATVAATEPKAAKGRQGARGEKTAKGAKAAKGATTARGSKAVQAATGSATAEAVKPMRRGRRAVSLQDAVADALEKKQAALEPTTVDDERSSKAPAGKRARRVKPATAPLDVVPAAKRQNPLRQRSDNQAIHAHQRSQGRRVQARKDGR